MAIFKTVGIKDLKNNLSAYLRDVQRGTRIYVSDRRNVVAELHEPGEAYAPPETGNPVLAEWIREGVVVLPSRKKAALSASPVRLEEGAAARLLEEDCAEKGE